MGVNEKQFGIRLKDPALHVIEKRAEEINKLAPEVKTTAGGIAKHAVEEYAKQLDRKDVESHLVMPFIAFHTQAEIKLDNHPFLEEKDLNVTYELEELEKLQAHFNGIFEILKNRAYLTERQLQAWEHVAYQLKWDYDHILSGLEHARELEEIDWSNQQ